MAFLIDTHVLIWWWSQDPSLSKRALEVIQDEQAVIYVSAIAGLEIALKFRAGKLPGMAGPLSQFDEAIRSEGFQHLGVRHDHTIEAGLLEGTHRDPFDRIIAAQGLIEDMTIVTRDAAFVGLGCKVLW